MADNEKELYAVTEVGTFGALNIEDPSKKRVLKESELDELIRESAAQNLNNCCDK